MPIKQFNTLDEMYMRVKDLAARAKIHQYTVERMIYRGIIAPDGFIRHGRGKLPIFLESRTAELVKAIREQQNN